MTAPDRLTLRLPRLLTLLRPDREQIEIRLNEWIRDVHAMLAALKLRAEALGDLVGSDNPIEIIQERVVETIIERIETITAQSDVVWEWNRVDTSQFGTGVGNVAGGSIALSVVADSEITAANLLRTTCTTFQGHFWFPILDLPELDESYVVRAIGVNGLTGATASDQLSLLVLTNLVAGISNGSLWGVQCPLLGSQTAIGTSPRLVEAGTRVTTGVPSMGTLAGADNATGATMEFEIRRDEDPNPQAEPRFAMHRVRAVTTSGEAADAVGTAQYTTSFAAGWSGLTLNRAGLGVDTSNVIGGTADLRELAILRWPLDR